MSNGKKATITLLVIFLVLTIALAWLVWWVFRDVKLKEWTSQSVESAKSGTESNVARGFSLSPKSYDEAGFRDFVQRIDKNSQVLSWAGKTADLSTDDSAAKTVVDVGRVYGLTPVVLVYPPNQDVIVGFAQKYKPAYLAIGVEVNRLKNDQLNDLIDKFPSIYSAVKRVSPDTEIFTVFQLENLKGLNGGLYGGENDTTKQEWELLDSFRDADLIGFTTYPGLIYKNPEEIPDEYYSEIADHTDKPVAFVEVGWPSETEAVGWESTEEEQARFINRFFELTNGLDVEMAIWSFLYDQDIKKPFKSLGLIDIEGKEKVGLRAWTNEE